MVHTTQGARTYQELGNFFANPSSGVSSHVGIDDTAGTVGEYVPRSGKAWTQANANPVCLSAELCAFAEWDAAEWDRHPNMIANTAAWVAEEAALHAIPINKLTPDQAQGNARGVCGHIDLGSWGGGHWDPGYSFPWDELIERARGSYSEAPKEDDVFIRSNDGRVRWLIYDGERSYWRLLPTGCEQNIKDRIIEDPNNSWLNLWAH